MLWFLYCGAIVHAIVNDIENLLPLQQVVNTSYLCGEEDNSFSLNMK
jgi:hypothetical protein